MAEPAAAIRPGLEWVHDFGVTERELVDFNPCVPGEFTMPDTFYLNSGTPRVAYRGTEEGTLPMVAGRWYLIPEDVASRHPELVRDTLRVARAVRLAR